MAQIGRVFHDTYIEFLSLEPEL